MRVLVLCEYESLNGGEYSLLEAIRRIRGSGITIEVAAPPSGGLARELQYHRLAHVPWSVIQADGSRQPRPTIRAHLQKLLVEARCDVVHANSVSMSRLIGPVVEQLGMPSLGYLRDIIRVSKRAIEDLGHHQVLIAVSEATRQWYAGMGLPPSQIRVLYNGVDLTRFRPRPSSGFLHRELNLPSDVPLVGSIGQLGMRKGVDLFVKAAARAAVRRDDIHFLFVGQRYSLKDEAVEFERRVRCAAEANGLRGRFHFLGVRSDIASVLNELTIYVHAARQEPLGRVLLEAGASGLPVVATQVGGTAEIFPSQQQAALLVAPDRADRLTDAILRLLHDPRLRQRLGQNARRYVAEQFDAGRAARELEACYRYLHGPTLPG